MLVLVERQLAELALALVEGVARGDHDADALITTGFDSVETAARAHAYLSGFLLQLLADRRSETPQETAAYVRVVLGAPS